MSPLATAPSAILSRVQSEPVEIPRVAGSVTVESTLWRTRVFVDGDEVPCKRRVFLLPATMGLPVHARLKYPSDPLPALEVGGTIHRFGPHNPPLLWLPAWLPMLWVTVGWAGAVTAAIGWATNAAVLTQTRWPVAKKAVAALAVSAMTIPVAGLLGVSLQDWYRDLSGQQPLSPRVVGFGDCVDTLDVPGAEVEVRLESATDCATPHDGEVVFGTTHGDSSASYAQTLGPIGWCREGGDVRLSSPVVDASYVIRVATDGDGVEHPQAGDTWACIVERQDGKQMVGPFSCADLTAAGDERCPDPLL